ncbi:hypothetical protein ABZ840_32630 [Streptomyces sp. NPDC047117]|uniref:hypothetical protein n=1 Tax=Streptomyces sp. NPDC047117 TaxID=3155379 RepID=UPI0033FE3ACD
MVEAHVNLVISVDESERADPDRVLRVHEKLVEAIFEGDGDAIDAEVEAHTQRSADELAELLAARRRGGRGNRLSEARPARSHLPQVVSTFCLSLKVFLVQEGMRASVATLYGRGRGVGE